MTGLANWPKKKLLHELQGDYSRFIPLTVESMKYKGRLFALPRNFEVITLFYNKKLVPRPPADLKSLIAISEHLRGKGIYGLMYDHTNFYYHAPWFYAYGGKIFNEQGDLLIGKNRGIESFRLVYDLQKKYRVLPEKSSQSAMINLFAAGQAGMVITGPWSLGEIEKNRISYGVSLLPLLEKGKRPQPFIGVKGYAVTSRSKHPREASEFVEYLTGYQPEKMAMTELGVLPSIQEIYTKEKLPESIRGFYEQAKYGTLMPTYPEMKYIWQEYNWALSQIFSSGEPVDKILAQAEKAVIRQIEKEKKL